MPRRLSQIFLLFTAASLSACSGVAGISTMQTMEGKGVRVFTVETRGVEIRNAAGNRGLSIGWRRTTLVYADTDNPKNDIPTSRPFGWCALPCLSPLYVASTGTGFDFSLDPDFWGVSAGRYSRAAARLPINSSALLLVHNSRAAAPVFSYTTTSQ